MKFVLFVYYWLVELDEVFVLFVELGGEVKVLVGG